MAFVRVHDALYQRSGGLIGHRIPGAPNSLLLHTVGAKTGLPRTNTLSYALDGDTYLVVASNGGDRRSPGWYHNLKANAEVEINVGRRRFAAVAHVGVARRCGLRAALADCQRQQRQSL